MNGLNLKYIRLYNMLKHDMPTNNGYNMVLFWYMIKSSS